VAAAVAAARADPNPPRSKESVAWRSTLTTESAEWRTFVNATIHAMGLAAGAPVAPFSADL
jgi:hypothetical protein